MNENQTRDLAVQNILTRKSLEITNLEIALEMANIEIKRLNVLISSKEDEDEEGN